MLWPSVQGISPLRVTLPSGGGWHNCLLHLKAQQICDLMEASPLTKTDAEVLSVLDLHAAADGSPLVDVPTVIAAHRREHERQLTMKTIWPAS